MISREEQAWQILLTRQVLKVLQYVCGRQGKRERERIARDDVREREGNGGKKNVAIVAAMP